MLVETRYEYRWMYYVRYMKYFEISLAPWWGITVAITLVKFETILRMDTKTTKFLAQRREKYLNNRSSVILGTVSSRMETRSTNEFPLFLLN